MNILRLENAKYQSISVLVLKKNTNYYIVAR